MTTNLLLRNSALLLCTSLSVVSADLGELDILFLADSDSSRTQEFTSFLRENVGSVKSVPRREFRPADGARFDVVLLDWLQSEEAREEWKSKRSPLGERADWGVPTVLLGSAGLNLAVTWSIRGGSG